MAVIHYVATLATIIAGILFHLYSSQREDRKLIVSRFDQQSKQTQDDLDHIKQQLIAAKENISNNDKLLQSHKDTYELTVKRLTLSNDVLSKENSQYEQTHDKLKSELDDLKSQIKQLEQNDLLLNDYELVESGDVTKKADDVEDELDIRQRVEREYEYKLNTHIESLITAKDLIISNQQTKMEGMESKFKNDLELLSSDGRRLERFIKRLENELLEKNKTADEQRVKITALESRVEEVLTENGKLITKIKQSDEALLKKSDELKSVIKEKNDDNEKSLMRVLSTEKASKEALEYKLVLEKQIKDRNVEFEKKLSEKQANIDEVNRALKAKQEEVDELVTNHSSEVNSLKRNYDEATSKHERELADEANKFKALENRLEEATSTHNSLIEAKDKEVSNIQGEIQNLKDFYSDKGFTPETFQAKIDEIRELTQKHASLERKLEQTKTNHEDAFKSLNETYDQERKALVDAYEAKITIKDDQLHKLIEQSLASSGINERAVKQHEDDIRRVRKEERDKSGQFHKRKITELTKQLELHIDKVSKDEYDQKVKELTKLNEELDVFKLQNDDLITKIANFDDQVVGLENEIEVLNNGYDENVKELKAMSEQLEVLKKKNSELEAERTTVEREVEKSKNSHADKVNELEEINKEHNELKKNKSELDTLHTTLQEEHEKTKVQLAVKEKELESSNEIKDEKIALLNETIGVLKKKNEEYTKLYEDYESLKVELDKAKRETDSVIDDLKLELDVLKKKESAQDDEIKQLKASIETTTIEYESKLGESSTSADLEELEGKYKSLQQEFEALATANDENLKTKEQDLNNVKQEIKLFQHQIKSKDEQIEGLKADTQEKVNQLFNKFLKIKGIDNKENIDANDDGNSGEFDIYKKFANSIDNISSRFNEVQEDVKSKDQEVKEVTSTLVEVKQALVSIKNENELQSKEIQTLSERKEELLKDIEDRDEQITKLERTIKQDVGSNQQHIHNQLLSHLATEGVDNEKKKVEEEEDSSVIKSPSSELSID